MKIIAFDIGIYNLAYGLVDYSEADGSMTILEWSLLPLKETKEKKDFGEITDKLVEVINEKFWDKEIDVVLIENQPVMKNPVMKTLQIMIYTFFMLKKRQNGLNTIIKLVSAQNKMKMKKKDEVDVSSVTTTDKYKRNKQLAILYTRWYLKGTDQTQVWIDTFEACRKKDDRADGLLMCIYYIEQNFSNFKVSSVMSQ